MITLKRTIWQRVLWWRYRLFQQHRHERLILEEVEGRPLLVLPGVMNPALFRSGRFLARCLTPDRVPAGCAVLDMGTGSGIHAIVAAARARRVVAVDVSPVAARCARINTLLNQVEEKVTVRQGDLFQPVAGEKFDLILFNPPYFRGEPTDAFDTAWRSNTVVERFAAGLGAYLTSSGSALVVLSSQGDEPAFLRVFREQGFALSVVARQDFTNEILTVYSITLVDGGEGG